VKCGRAPEMLHTIPCRDIPMPCSLDQSFIKLPIGKLVMVQGLMRTLHPKELPQRPSSYVPNEFRI
ncbi:MAG: hypothetical protein ACRDF4_11665, partial [Rhabdochlamydiaceae bacterium]